MILGSDDLPVMTYTNRQAGALYLAHCDNIECSSSTIVPLVDNGSGFSTWPSDIAIGPMDFLL